MQREDNVKTQGEDSHLTAKERCLAHTFPLGPEEGASSAKTLISDIQRLGCEMGTSCGLSLSVCGTSLQQPWQTKHRRFHCQVV